METLVRLGGGRGSFCRLELRDGVGPAAAAAMGVVLKVFPDVLDVGVVLKHGAGLAVYAAV